MAYETDQYHCAVGPGAHQTWLQDACGGNGKVLGQRIAITNTPGASGAIGTRAMFDAPRDGYTWSGNADGSIATYQI